MKILDLSPEGMGVPALEMIDKNTFEKFILKCGKYISRIIYKINGYKLHQLVRCKLPSYISTYCFNVTSLDMTQPIFYPKEIGILAQNCKQIIELKLLLSPYSYTHTKMR